MILNPIYSGFCENKTLHTMIHLLPSIFLDIGLSVESKYFSDKRCGGVPKFSPIDSTLFYLYFLANGDTLEHGTALFQDHISTIESTINRIRPYVFKVLMERWKDKPKPKFIQGVDPLVSRIGLIVDSTTIEVNKPTGHFEESKIYYDVKNEKYGIKKVCYI